MSFCEERDGDDIGRRCSIGCETWPNTSQYKTCPQCGEETRVYSAVDPLDDDEARSKRLLCEFEAQYGEARIT